MAQLAQAIGAAPNTISNWETGKRGLDLGILQRIADAYGIPPFALLLSPDDAEQAQVIQRASEIVLQLDANSADEWLRIGARLASKPGTN